MYALSKSRYCNGVQCPKILWMGKYMPDKALSQDIDSILLNGQKVGETARGYFGKYVLVDTGAAWGQRIQQTTDYMKSEERAIAEACFDYDGLYCAVDILKRNGDGWDILEVKSSTQVTDIYLDDIAFQYYVLKKAGVNVNSAYILHINSGYVRHGDLNLGQLFELEEYTDACKNRYSEVEKNVTQFRKYVNQTVEPARDIDLYCDDPYECIYKEYCGRHLPEHSVFDVHGMTRKKKYELYHKGIISFADILNSSPKISAKQYMQVEAEELKKPDVIEKKAIQTFLSSLSYPLYHLDFETFQQAIPEFEGESPYTQIPFQYSLHIEQADGTLTHKEFLAKEGTDPRRALAESLVKNIPIDVCCLAYNMSFEKRVIRRLADQNSDLESHLMCIHDNLHDLMIPFQRGQYYTRSLQGSYSIKYVLPALCPGDPDLDYHQLDEVHNGSEASFAFADMPNHTPEEIAGTRKNLLKYCGLDTLGMVKVLGRLRDLVK